LTKNDKRLRGSVFVLSGEELTIPFGEIRALVLTYEPSALIQRKARRIITSTLSDEKLIEKVTQRAAYCRFGGKLISESNEASSLTQDFETDIIPKKRTFAVDSVSLTMYQCGEIGAKIKSMTNAKVSLGNPDYVFQAEAIPEGLIFGLSKQGYKIFEWRHRRPRSRRFFLPSAIYPKLARALVNLSRVRENERFVDPFCGTGSLLIESSMMGMKTIGIDITRWIARGAALNLSIHWITNQSL
jgi:tRNA (guanine10-N2)-dimethyltransferase